MGGSGSGRSYGSRYTKDNCLTLDLNFIAKKGGIRTRRAQLIWYINDERHSALDYQIDMTSPYGPRLTLDYKTKGEDVTEGIRLSTTPQRLGGVRYWMHCPILRGDYACNRRCSKLYSAPGCKYFGCRDCLDITYQSCQDSHKNDRFIRGLALELGYPTWLVKKALSHKYD
jgi:hypothetical protein